MWWVVAALFLALVVAAFFVPLRVRFNLQARGEPDGFWAIAGGSKVGPVAASGLVARGVDAKIQVHVFGRQLWARTPKSKAEPEPEPEPLQQRAERGLARARRGYAKVTRFFDPLDLGEFLIRERRRIVFDEVVLDLDYSFVDIATTGKLLGAVYALSALLPSNVIVRQTPSWESVDRANLAGSGLIIVYPGLLVVDAAWFLVRNTKLRRPKGRRGAQEAS